MLAYDAGHLILVSIATVTALSKLCAAQDLPGAINGCDVVDCPGRDDGTTGANCTLLGSQFQAIGLARIPTTSKSQLKGLSLLQGVEIDGKEDVPDGVRPSKTQFFLGTPENLNLAGTGACAVFFKNVSKSVEFEYGAGSEQQGLSQGTCEDAMSKECVAALNRRASQIDYEGLSSSEACDKLESDLADNLDKECDSFANGSKWSALVARPLTGSKDVRPITPEQNSSTNCWPITPKSDKLALVDTAEETGDFNLGTLVDWFWHVTPVLTVFFKGEGNSTLVTETETYMTCLKTIGKDDPSEATRRGGDGEGKGNRLRLDASLGFACGLVWLVTFFM